jgi:hypothetical protein
MLSLHTEREEMAVSAWAVGAMTTTVRRRQRTGVGRRDAEAEVEQEASVPSVDVLVAWIPGEVIAGYAAIVLALQPVLQDGTQGPLEITSKWWLIAAALAAGIIAWLGGWSKVDDLTASETWELLTRAVLAAVAFVIWSFVVPGSWWYSIDQIAEQQDVALIVAGIVAVGFSLFAEGLTRRIAR